jgi:hypothetical protein
MKYIKEHLKWIVSIILLVLTFLFIYISYKNGAFKEKQFKQIEFETTNTVFNVTEQDYYDDVVNAGLLELGIDSTIVVIRPITQKAKDNFGSDMELKAHIIGKDKNYVIWIDDVSKSESIGVLAHELIHLVQYQTKQIQLESGYVIWENKKYTIEEMSEIEYFKRPWEEDAFNRYKQLQLKIEKVLYE